VRSTKMRPCDPAGKRRRACTHRRTELRAGGGADRSAPRGCAGALPVEPDRWYWAIVAATAGIPALCSGTIRATADVLRLDERIGGHPGPQQAGLVIHDDDRIVRDDVAHNGRVLADLKRPCRKTFWGYASTVKGHLIPNLHRPMSGSPTARSTSIFERSCAIVNNTGVLKLEATVSPSATLRTMTVPLTGEVIVACARSYSAVFTWAAWMPIAAACAWAVPTDAWAVAPVTVSARFANALCTA